MGSPTLLETGSANAMGEAMGGGQPLLGASEVEMIGGIRMNQNTFERSEVRRQGAKDSEEGGGLKVEKHV